MKHITYITIAFSDTSSKCATNFQPLEITAAWEGHMDNGVDCGSFKTTFTDVAMEFIDKLKEMVNGQ